jgi:hypothetical protein
MEEKFNYGLNHWLVGWLVSESSKSENHYQKTKGKMGKNSSIRHFEYK